MGNCLGDRAVLGDVGGEEVPMTLADQQVVRIPLRWSLDQSWVVSVSTEKFTYAITVTNR